VLFRATVRSGCTILELPEFYETTPEADPRVMPKQRDTPPYARCAAYKSDFLVEDFRRHQVGLLAASAFVPRIAKGLNIVLYHCSNGWKDSA